MPYIFMDFKLIAIRALEGCHADFRKNLNEGYIYKIYRRYRLEDVTGAEITERGKVENVKLLPSQAEGLYQLKTKDGRLLDLNISAIVGKNGTGKSTISELFFATIYVFSLRAGLLQPNNDSLTGEYDDLKSRLEKLSVNHADRQVYGKIKRLIKSGNPPSFEKARSLFRSYELAIETHFKNRTAAENRMHVIEKEKQEIERLNTGLKSEIIFSLSKTVLSLEISNEYPAGFNIRILNSETEDDKNVLDLVRDIKIGKLFDAETFLPGLFFYTVAINYSNYSLNSDVVGKWVQWLFHKNDGYRSPLVINPMRTKGEFKIEKETRFAKYRLLSNLLSSYKENKGNQKLLLTDVQYVKNIRFTLNEKK